MVNRKGIIVRISVWNLGTFRSCDIFPGPNLNLILGPNGTGKSTIVSGIILGLGGNPKTIGRASQLSDYIRVGCDEAKIEVELISGDQCPNIIITRQFDKRSRSTWLLNNKTVTQKQILEVIHEYCIQVDNLCQFLPQDKVQDFAKMNNQELLLNTQKSVGPADLTECYEKLIETRNKHKELENKNAKQMSNLQQLNEKNNRMADIVKRINAQRNLMSTIKHLKSKLIWMQYRDVREQALIAREDKTKAAAALETHKKNLEIFDKKLKAEKKSISSLQDVIINMNQLISSTHNIVRDKVEETEHISDSIKTERQNLEIKVKNEQERDRTIRDTQNKIDKLENDIKSLTCQFGSDKEITQQILNLRPQMDSTDHQITQLTEKKNELENTLHGLKMKMVEFESEKRLLENVKNQQLNKLQQMNNDAYRGVLWLRENKHLFKYPVYEPIMLELNVTNIKDAKFIENTISRRDLYAFICEDADDMNTLIRHLRNDNKLRVNVALSGPHQPPSSSYKPPVPLDQLAPYGVYAYISHLFTCPESIMKYLCKTFRIHSIPVGVKYERAFELPEGIMLAFSDSHRFITKYSRYSKEKSTQVTEISQAKIFTTTVNKKQLNRLQQSIVKLQSQMEKVSVELRQIKEQITDLIEARNALTAHKNQLQGKKSQIDSIETRLKLIRQNLKDIQDNQIDIEAEEAKTKEKIKELIQKKLEAQSIVQKKFKKYQEHIIAARSARIKLGVINKRNVDLYQQHNEALASVRRSETTLNKVKESFERLKNEGKEIFEAAKKTTDGLTPNDDGFKKFKDIFDTLPENANAVKEMITHTQAEKDCMGDEDEDIIKEYEKCKEQIAQTIINSEQLTSRLKEIEAELNTLRLRWLVPLQELIDRINLRFAEYFNKMGYSGEVSVVSAENIHDYDTYGLSIRVSFREGEVLKELNQYTQSGGERAVTTAIYMLSLQELTFVPFRCVDEINQGMDSINERKIFDLIVDTTSAQDTSQYFLVTPKLLPNLKCTPTMTVHIIHNGAYLKEKDDFSVKRMLERLKKSTIN